MVHTSKTGLLASLPINLTKYREPGPVQLKIVAKAAPYMLKPFAGLYNPYPYGCSLLCNHPADNEARELVKRAKDTWASEGKNILLVDEVNTIRAALDQLQVRVTDYSRSGDYPDNALPIASVPEELFRRYTETDSRPLTPALTLMSAHTRASGSRRCVTPDPIQTAEGREKTMLILDLRRSHSQETLSWHGSIQQHQQEVPSIKIIKAPTDKRASTSHSPDSSRKRSAKTPSPVKSAGKSDLEKIEKTYLEVTPAQTDGYETEEDVGVEEEEEGEIKRRGRRRRSKRGRDSSRGPPAFQSSIDPETQIATIGPESHNPSARPSLVPNEPTIITQVVNEEIEQPLVINVPIKPQSLQVHSYLDIEIIKLLRRELNEEIIDNEFNMKRRKALEEAMKTSQLGRTDCNELKELQKELKLSAANEDLWLGIPRMFSRSSARFELPMDSREFNTMTPMDYVQEYVNISRTRKQLYNCIFNRHKNETDIENEHLRRVSGMNIQRALNEMMGKSMTEAQARRFHDLVGWTDDDTIDFKTFCGLCALCERIFAPEYLYQMPSKKINPCHEIETVDFQSLTRRLDGQNPDKRLVEILCLIKDS